MKCIQDEVCDHSKDHYRNRLASDTGAIYGLRPAAEPMLANRCAFVVQSVSQVNECRSHGLTNVIACHRAMPTPMSAAVLFRRCNRLFAAMDQTMTPDMPVLDELGIEVFRLPRGESLASLVASRGASAVIGMACDKSVI